MNLHDIPFVVIFILIACSAFFSGSETGLTAVSRAKIHKLKSEGSKRAGIVEKLHETKDQLIGAILLGNNLVNILASALATSIAIGYFGEEGVVYATIVMTALVLIFAEVLPKTYAFYNAEKVALNVAPILLFITRIFSPITKAVQVIVNWTMHSLGIKMVEGEEVLSGIETLRGSIELHHKEGDVEKYDRDMLDSILDLAETEIKDVMTHRTNMFSIEADKPPSEIINEILDSPHSRIPVWRDVSDNIMGILHVKDMLQELRSHEDDMDEINILKVANEPWYVPETRRLIDQLKEFRRRKSHLAIVVDEYGDVVGLVTLEDVLEEIVGQIQDEHDTEVPGIKKLNDGGYKIDAKTNIRVINRQLHWNLPDDDAATLAGLIIHEAETIPEVGEEFQFHGYIFQIVKRKRNQVTQVNVWKLPVPKEE